MIEKELESLLQALDQTLLQHRQLIEMLSKTEVPELAHDWYRILRMIISNKKYVHHFHELPKNVDIVSRENFIVEFCRGRRVLHVGCVDEGLLEAKLQSGNLLHQKLQEVSQHLVGIDISFSGIELLRKAGFQDVFLLDVTDVDKLPYRDFDVILLGEVLEHLPNPGQALSALAAFSNADFLITVPNRFSWEGTFFARRDIEFVNPDHCYYFSYHTLRMLLQKCNYRILDMRYYTHQLSNPGFVAKLKERPQFCEGLICIARVGRTAEGESIQPLAQSQQKLMSLLDQQINTEEGTLLSIQKELSTLKAELIQMRQKMLAENQTLREQLHIKEQAIKQLIAQSRSEEQELQQALVQLQDKHQELQLYLQSKEQELQQAAAQLQMKDKELARVYEEVAKLKKALAEVHNSLGWKLLGKFWRLTNRLLPPETRRRLWFNRALFVIKVIINEGWGSLWRRIRQKLGSKTTRGKTPDHGKTEQATSTLTKAAVDKPEKTRLMVVVPLMQAGGAERRTSILLEQLDRKLIEPELTVVFNREIFYPIPEDVRLHILEQLPQPTARISEYIKLPDYLKDRQQEAVFLETVALKLANLVQQQQCEVILSTQFWTSIIAVLARKYLPSGISIIATVDNHPSTFLLNDKNGALFAYLVREHFNEADHVVAVGQGVAQDLIDHFGVKAEKIEVIYTPTHLKKIQKSAEEKVEHPWFREEVPLVLFVGRLQRVKGVEHLLRAFARVRGVVRARCVLVGDGEERGKLEELVRELGIGGDVYFAGRQSNPFKYMRRATVFVLPSLSEGLPNVLIEAMACGCPVIASDVASGGSREVVGDGEYGVLVPPGDEEALTKAILQVLQNPSLRRKLSQLGVQRAQQFDVSRSLQKYMRLIRSLHEEGRKLRNTVIKPMVVVPLMEAGGAERGTALLLQHLDRRLVKPELAIAFNREIFYPVPGDVWVHVLEKQPEPQQAISEPNLPPDLLEYRSNILWLEKMALKLATLVKERQSSVVLSTQLWSSIIATMARKYLPSQVRIIAMVVSHPSTRLPGKKYATLYAYLMREHLNEADRVVAVSEGIAQDLVENYGVKPEKIDVIYYPVDWAQVQKLAHEPVEHEWLSEEIPIVLFVGRLEAVKGVEHLLRAFARVRGVVRARCVLVGDGEERGKLEELVRELGIGGDVYFAGRQSNPFKYMRRATVFVLPSLSEGLPNVLIEAMACGCPVIASDVASGGSREVVGDGEYGVLVPPGDEEALAQAIIRLLQDTTLRNTLAQAGQKRAKEFDVPQIFRKYRRLIVNGTARVKLYQQTWNRENPSFSSSLH